MAFITDILNTIKNARKGKDMRQAIYDGIQQCYKDATGHPDSVAAVVERLKIEKGRIDELATSQTFTGNYTQSNLVFHAYRNATTGDPDPDDSYNYEGTSGKHEMPICKIFQEGTLDFAEKQSNEKVKILKEGLYIFELRIFISGSGKLDIEARINDVSQRYNAWQIVAQSTEETKIIAYILYLKGDDVVSFYGTPGLQASVRAPVSDVNCYVLDWIGKAQISDCSKEISDIRVGEDGAVYGTAGEAVRKQIGNITEDLGNIGKVIEVGGEKTITTPQLADISTIKVGRPTFKYHQTKYNDELSSEEYYRTLDAIEFTDESIKTLRLNFKPASIICFRAQDGMAEGVVPIANVTDNGDNSFSFATTTANKAKWIRISWSNTQYPNLVPLVTNEDEWDANADKTFIGSKIIKLPTSLKDKVVNISNLGDDVLKLFNPEIINPCDYKGDEIRIFGKGLCIGDSLTYGQSDRNDTGSLDGFKHAGMNYPDNLMRLTGIDLTNAGTAGKTFQTWWELHENDDFSGHDFCIIALGVNDAYFNKMWTDDSLTYLTNIVNAVRTANNHIPIFITTPPMYFLGYTGADFESVAEGIRNAATSLNLYLVDFRKYLTEFSRVNAEKVSVMAYGHFNAYGYYKIAVAYKSYISYIISQNMDDFRNVQFVGTNYSYSSN